MSFEHIQQEIDSKSSRQEKYKLLKQTIISFVESESHPLSIISNIVATIHDTLGVFWTGFYAVSGNQLILFPFQGPLACTKIDYEKGVCGKAWAQNTILIVPNVEQFPGHIACSSMSKSEIVIPIRDNDDNVLAILDIDSDKLGYFDELDAANLEIICQSLSDLPWKEMTKIR